MSNTTQTPAFSKNRFLGAVSLRFEKDDPTKFAEAHSTWYNQVIEHTENGPVVISVTEEKAPIGDRDENNANLTAVLGELHVSSLATIQQLQADVAQHKAENAALKAQLEAKG